MYFCRPLNRLKHITKHVPLILALLLVVNITASAQEEYILDDLGIFSQVEKKELAYVWEQYAEKEGLRFALAIWDSEEEAKKSELFMSSLTDGSGVTFNYLHEDRRIIILPTEDLKKMVDPMKEKLIEDVMIPNFERGWWKYGFEQASKQIVRKKNGKGGMGLSNSAVWLWLVSAIAIIGLLYFAQMKNAVTITAEKIHHRNILRTSPKEEEAIPDERKGFDGSGTGTSW